MAEYGSQLVKDVQTVDDTHFYVGVMMPKPQDIFQLAQQEAVRVTASPQAWQSFLYTAAHNYHFFPGSQRRISYLL